MLTPVCVNPSCEGKTTCLAQFCPGCWEVGHRFWSLKCFKKLVLDAELQVNKDFLIEGRCDVVRYVNRVKSRM